MALSETKIREYTMKLMKSRLRLLCTNGFYGLLLMHLVLTIDEKCETVATDGTRLTFNPDFLENLTDSQLDVVMMHEILHIVLQHPSRYGDFEPEKFDIACDIVVNSVILESLGGDIRKITLDDFGELIHTTPNGKEGSGFTAEEVYEMLPAMNSKKSKNMNNSKNQACSGNGNSSGDSVNSEDSSDSGDSDNSREGKESGNGKGKGFSKGPAKGKGQSQTISLERTNGVFDSHEKWKDVADDNALREKWVKRMIDAAEAMSIRESSTECGTVPAFAQRMINQLKKPQTNWRAILDAFIQEEICDYSFNPPDRRFQDSDFFLPDFNEKDDSVKNILFMIDTSASMSDEMITTAVSEIKGAIDQFNGKLEGLLGFFDADIIEPKPFETVDELLLIKPAGGGGTDFFIIFNYVNDNMYQNPPTSIVILTDGHAFYPDEEITNGIPVLWLINNEKVTPPWGKTARIEV